MSTVAMRQFSVTATNSFCSWSATTIPKTPPLCALDPGQIRLSVSRRFGFLGGDGTSLQSLGVGRRRLSGVDGRRSSKRVATKAAFISPPADPQFANLDNDGMEDVLGSVPVAPRGPKPIITWSLVLGLLWKQKLRLSVAAMALLAATTCTLMMPLFSGLSLFITSRSSCLYFRFFVDFVIVASKTLMKFVKVICVTTTLEIEVWLANCLPNFYVSNISLH